MSSVLNKVVEKPGFQELWKLPLRLINLGLLNGPYYKGDVAGTPYTVLDRRGRCRLLKYSPTNGIPPVESAVFVTPSLINRFYILDLFPGCSFIENLVDQGKTVYLLDWGAPRDHDRFSTMEDHILNWMDWAFERSLKDWGGEKLHMFGQCIGGTFAAIYTALYPEKVASLVCLTAPIDFHDGGTFYKWTNDGGVDLEEMAEVWGNINHRFLNHTFKMLTPLGDLKKYQNLLKLSWKRDFVKKYAAMDRWLGDNVSFPGKTYEKYIQDLYRENKLIKGEFMLADKKVNLKNIKCPTLCLVAKGDIIVTPKSALPLMDAVGTEDKESLALGGGHIGCVISDKHQKVFWEKVTNWFDKYNDTEKKIRRHFNATA